VAAALAVARQLPGTAGEQLADAARTAFASGLNAVGVAGALIFVGLTVLAATVLRKVDEPVPAAAEEPTPVPTRERELVDVH
jgi:DHA2 family multidrug resistance protein-like MFS transporter